MTLEDRIERGRRLCEKLQAEVEAIQSRYLATSPEKRELLSGLDADFLIMLTAWEATGEELSRRAAGERLVAFAQRHVAKRGGTMAEALQVAYRLNPEWVHAYLDLQFPR